MLRVAPSGFPFAKEFAGLDAEIVKLQLCKPAQGLSRPEKFVRYCADKLPLLTKAGICVRELRLGRPGDARVTYVYILRSVDHPKRYYVGVTAALRDRLSKHNSGDVSHTSKYAPWTIKTYIAFSDERQAVAFEKYLKSPSGRAFAKKRL